MRDALSSQRGMLKLLAAAALVPLAISLEAGQAAKPISIEGATGLEFVQVVPQTATYKEHKALRLVQTPNATIEGVALVNAVEFKNGTIDVDLAGLPGSGSDQGARGFVGIAARNGDNDGDTESPNERETKHKHERVDHCHRIRNSAAPGSTSFSSALVVWPVSHFSICRLASYWIPRCW